MRHRAPFVLSWVLLALAVALVACRPATGGASPSAGAWVGELTGLATAGPVCPVERTPPDPSCAPRAVAGARLLVQDAAERTVGTLVTDADGRFSARLPAGTYHLVPQPVVGLLGTAPPVSFKLGPGSPTATIAVDYDTGIR